MKINQSIIKLLLCGAVLAVGTGCTSNYDEINRNPGEVTDEEMDRDGYNIISALTTMQNNVIPVDVNACQFTECLLGGPWGGYFADSNSGWSAKFSTFNAPDNWSKVMFTDLIPKLYPAHTKLKAATEDVIPLSVAKIINLMAMQRITDCYGPIPYSKIGVDGKLEVPYDSQRAIYMLMFEELDKAIDDLTDHQTDTFSANADMIYGGNVTNWIKLANSLKLRMAMRIVYAEPGFAQEKAEEAVGHPVGVITSNAENAALRTFGDKGNPMNTAVKYNDGDSRASADLTSYMNGYEDPRRSAYFNVSKFSAMPYAGLRSGINIPSADVFTQYSEINIGDKSPLQWMNAAEVAFLRAEGVLRTWNMGGGSARDFYEQGIALSFEQWSVQGASEYAKNDSRMPADYADPKGLYSGNAPSSVTIAWNDGDDFEVNLERIIVQKWIANYTLGQEAWAERRRTGYPRLMPVVVNGNPSVLGNAACPRRLPYPVDEYLTNGANVNAAVGMLGGADNIATPLWWDCKPKN